MVVTHAFTHTLADEIDRRKRMRLAHLSVCAAVPPGVAPCTACRPTAHCGNVEARQSPSLSEYGQMPPMQGTGDSTHCEAFVLAATSKRLQLMEKLEHMISANPHALEIVLDQRRG